MDHEHFSFADFNLRAVRIDGIEITNSQGFENEDGAWFWFAGSLTADEWFAVGITDVATAPFAAKIYDEMDHSELNVMLPYVGEPWENIILINAAAFGQQQRLLLQAFNESGAIVELAKCSRQELLDLREAETDRRGFDGSMN